MVVAFGKEVNNAKRWLVIGGIQFQPSETAKILLILFFAQFIMKHKEEMGTLKIVGSCVLLFVPSTYLILKQPDLSTSIMVVILFCVVMFVGGVSWKYVILAISIAVPAFYYRADADFAAGAEIINDSNRGVFLHGFIRRNIPIRRHTSRPIP